MVLCPGWDGEGWGRRAGEGQRGCPAKRGKHGRRSVSGAGLAAKTVRHFALASLFETAVAAGGGEKKKKKHIRCAPSLKSDSRRNKRSRSLNPGVRTGRERTTKKRKKRWMLSHFSSDRWVYTKPDMSGFRLWKKKWKKKLSLDLETAKRM